MYDCLFAFFFSFVRHSIYFVCVYFEFTFIFSRSHCFRIFYFNSGCLLLLHQWFQIQIYSFFFLNKMQIHKMPTSYRNSEIWLRFRGGRLLWWAHQPISFFFAHFHHCLIDGLPIPDQLKLIIIYCRQFTIMWSHIHILIGDILSAFGHSIIVYMQISQIEFQPNVRRFKTKY